MSNKRIYIHSIATKFMIVALSFLDTVIINRMMEVSVRGDYGIVTNSVTVLNLIFCFSIGASYQLYYKQGEKTKKLFLTLVSLQNFAYLIMAILYFLFTRNVWIFLVLIIAIFSIMRDNISSLILVENLKVRNNIYLFSNIVYTAILCFFLVFNISNIYSFLIALFFRYFFEIFLSIIIQKYYRFLFLSSVRELDTVKSIFNTSVAISIMGILITCNYNIDVIMLKWLNVDSYNIGLYSVAATLVNMVWIIPDAFKDVIINRLSRYDAVGEVKQSIKINILICSIILLGFIIFGKWFIEVFYGDKYLGSYGLTSILLFGSIPMVFFKLINPYLLSIGKKRYVIIFLSISVISNIISNFIAIPIFGEYGAAVSSVISYSLCGFLFLLFFYFNNKKQNNHN